MKPPILFALSLFIAIAGNAQHQPCITKDGYIHYMRGSNVITEFYDPKVHGPKPSPCVAEAPPQTRIAPQFVTQEHEIQELRNRLDSLIKALREKPFNGAWLDELDTFRTIAPGIILTPSPFPRTFIDSTTQSLISISPDGWTSVTAMPKRKRKKKKQ